MERGNAKYHYISDKIQKYSCCFFHLNQINTLACARVNKFMFSFIIINNKAVFVKPLKSLCDVKQQYCLSLRQECR